jgi:hypothetical protein
MAGRLPVWDKLPPNHVRVSRIRVSNGRSLFGREIPVHGVPERVASSGWSTGPSNLGWFMCRRFWLPAVKWR